MSTEDDSHKVGYGKPPVHSRFRPGQSGNPRGRPRKRNPYDIQTGSLNMALLKVGRQTVRLTEGGVTKKIEKIEAFVLKAFNQALTTGTAAQQRTLMFAYIQAEREERAGLGEAPLRLIIRGGLPDDDRDGHPPELIGRD